MNKGYRLILISGKVQVLCNGGNLHRWTSWPGWHQTCLNKLTAIVDWKTPTDLQNIGSFLGLAGYFWSLIKGYASIAQSLSDLARKVELPKLKWKAAYMRAMKGYSLKELWKKEHNHTFL